MKRLTSWALFVLLVLFLFVAAFGQADVQSMVRLAFDVNGEVWAGMTPREKGILVSGIVGGLVVASYAEVARSRPGSGEEIFSRIAVGANLGQLVRNMDAFYSDPSNGEICVSLALMLRECDGGPQMTADLQAWQEKDW